MIIMYSVCKKKICLRIIEMLLEVSAQMQRKFIIESKHHMIDKYKQKHVIP